MKSRFLILSLLFVVLAFEPDVHSQRKRQPPQKSAGGKPTSAPTQARKPATRKETLAEKIVLEGTCKSPSPSVWINAYDINIASSHRSDPYLVRFPDVLNRAILLIHVLKAADLKYLYETKSYKTEVFPTTYKEHESGLEYLMAKGKDALRENSGATVSSSDRSAMYPVIKAYFIDVAITIQELPKASMRGNFAAAYKENERAIEELAKGNPSEGLSSFSDAKESSLIKVMIAYLFDFAGFVQASYQSSNSGNLAVAYEKNKAKIEALAAATNWESRGIDGEERAALRRILEASAVDAASLLREAYKTSNKGSFGEVYAKNATAIESLASKNWEKDSSSDFANAAPALCQVLTAYQGPR